MFTTSISYLLLALVAVISAQALDLDLNYDPKTGRVTCDSDKRPTHSVFWDRISQDVAAAAAKGPTISSGLYAIMHSAIFDAWKVTHKRRGRQSLRRYPYRRRGYRSRKYGSCSLKKLAMSHAAKYAIASIIPEGKKAAAQAFNELHAVCRKGRRFTYAKSIGRRSAKKIVALYESNVLPADQPQFAHSSPIEKWTPERIPIDSATGTIQEYLTSGWGNRFTFGIRDGSAVRVKAPVPALLVSGTLDVNAATVTLKDGEVLRVTPKLVGSVINPAFVRQADRVVKASADLTEKQKFIAEFWEQGGKTSFPPGVWMTIAQYVSFRDGNTDDEDVGLFYAMSNAMNDAGVSTWFIKLFYNYARPVRVIRDLGKLGLMGMRRFYSILQGRVIRAPASRFLTYQSRDSHPSPPFPEYTSGHSTFSGSGAEVLKRWTGSDYFGGSVTIKARESRFEPKKFPKRAVTLQWKTFTMAANEAGISRIFGGIHFDDANDRGLTSGKVIGRAAFSKAFSQWRGRFIRRRYNHRRSARY